MYSEVKSNDKVLINRLDDNEKILLSDFYNKAIKDGYKLSLSELTDESGDFGGVMLNLEEISKDIHIEPEIPTSLSLEVGDSRTIEINTDVESVKYYSCNDKTAIDIDDSYTNGIKFDTLSVTDNGIIYYTIYSEGYNTVSGTIKITITSKENQKVILNVKDEEDNVVTNYTASVLDSNSTSYIIHTDEDEKYVELPAGSYTINISAQGYKNYTLENYEITETMLDNPSDGTLNIVLETA